MASCSRATACCSDRPSANAETSSATVNEIARTLELSRTSAENAMTALADAGLVGDAPAVSAGGAGRPARRFTFAAASAFVVGVDVGAASPRVVISDLSGRIVAHRHFDGVAAPGDGAAKLAVVVGGIRATLKAAAIPVSRVRAMGVSLPGIVDDTGRVVAYVVIPEWSGGDIGAQLRQELGCPVSVDNGVRLAAVAEHHLGAAQLVDDVAYISVGRRIALGLILGGSPRRGIHNAAGDIGRLAFRGLVTRTGGLIWRSGGDAEEVFSRAAQGHVDAVREVDAFVAQLAWMIAALVMTVDPAMVVIGGGLSAQHERLLDPLRTAVTAEIGLPFAVPLVEARLGAEAASHGAVVFAFDRHAGQIYGLPGMPVPPVTPLPPDLAGLPAAQGA